MMRWLTGLLGLLLAGLSGCGAVRLEAKPQLPPPLIDQLPATVAVHYPDEFRSFLYQETRYGIKYEFLLGPAHVVKLQRLLEAMFSRVIEVKDPAQLQDEAPGAQLVLQPHFEDYAFLTPQDMAGDYFTVTIRYRLDLYSPAGERVDGYVFTGYGREKSGTFSGNTEPLTAATQRAMRDAGAKLAVELASQESVRRLLQGEDVRPVHSEAQQVQEALGSFGPPPGQSPDAPVAGDGETPAEGVEPGDAAPGPADRGGIEPPEAGPEAPVPPPTT
jgi:hypothetical protein